MVKLDAITWTLLLHGVVVKLDAITMLPSMFMCIEHVKYVKKNSLVCL